ncbi:MAG: hypothetical protein JJT94_08220 [Bernardetiaceae bacterium]|nr:hypothetical protein [Bernardetiaceae bacterium]
MNNKKQIKVLACVLVIILAPLMMYFFMTRNYVGRELIYDLETGKAAVKLIGLSGKHSQQVFLTYLYDSSYYQIATTIAVPDISARHNQGDSIFFTHLKGDPLKAPLGYNPACLWQDKVSFAIFMPLALVLWVVCLLKIKKITWG